MNYNMRQVVKWILTESDAPVNIKDMAFDLMLSQEPISRLGQFVVTVPVYQECKDSMSRGKKIPAIKALRKATGCGLVDGKEAIEREFNDEYKKFNEYKKFSAAEKIN